MAPKGSVLMMKRRSTQPANRHSAASHARHRVRFIGTAREKREAAYITRVSVAVKPMAFRGPWDRIPILSWGGQDWNPIPRLPNPRNAIRGRELLTPIQLCAA